MGSLKSLPPRLGSAPPKLKAAPKVAESFYTSPEWRALAKRAKQRAGWRCEDVIDVRGVKVRCGSRERLIADHVVERKDGGAELDLRNILVRCAGCHNRKTAVARRVRAGGG